MKIVGLITEYNPFHNGHLYHIQKAKEISGADAAVVVMSGNYVQRGAPAIMPKHLRAEVALEAGVPVVMELPVCYAAGSAEYFAAGAISLFEQLGCIDSICFGSECGDYKVLERIARVTADEPEEYKFSLQEALRKGISFPRARQMALKAYLRMIPWMSYWNSPITFWALSTSRRSTRKKAASRLIPSNAWYPATTMRN